MTRSALRLAWQAGAVLACAIGFLTLTSSAALADRFPINGDFNGLVITYTVSGAELATPQDTGGFTTTRTYEGSLSGGRLEVSGTVQASAGWAAWVSVTVSAGENSDSFAAESPSAPHGLFEAPWSQPFTVAVDVPNGASSGSFSIDLSAEYNAGGRGLAVSGTFGGNESGSGTTFTTTAGVPASRDLIEAERRRLGDKYKGLEKGHILYRQGYVSYYGGDDFGHVGLYIGDHEATREYTVDKDVGTLKVFRQVDGVLTQIDLRGGEKVQKGDSIVGAVVEMLGSGAVLNTVERFENMAVRNPSGNNKDMTWRTTPVPPTPEQLTTIIAEALSIAGASQDGRVQYDLGEKGSTDWTSSQQEFDCVNMVEYCYEKAGLNPTPDGLEGGRLTDWYLRPQEQYDSLAAPGAEPKRVSISVKSPVNLHVYDATGRHVGLNAMGELEKDIPLVYFQPEEGGYPQGIIMGNVEEEYRLVLEGTDEGSFHLRIHDYNVSSLGDETEVRFPEVPITKGARAELIVAPGGTYQMGIDENGDGSNDRVIAPAEVTVTPIGETEPSSWLARYWWIVVVAAAVVLIVVGIVVGLRQKRGRQGPLSVSGGPPGWVPSTWAPPAPAALLSQATPAGWYVARGQQVHGPYLWDDMRRMAHEGHLLRHDLVWHATRPFWVQGETVVGLFTVLPEPR